MVHRCDAALVTCEDFRLHQRADGRNCMAELIHKLGTDCDIITRAGAIQDLVRPKQGHDESLVRDLAVSVELHHVRRILLVQHQDCGAYKPHGFTTPEAEVRQHADDLRAAQAILRARFPGVEVVLFIARLEPGTGDVYKVEPAA